MSSRGARRAPAAVRTRALCVVLLLLLQHAWCRLPCPAAADPIYTVSIKRYMVFPYSYFQPYGYGIASYPAALDICRQRGSFLIVDQTDAVHDLLTSMLKANFPTQNETVFTYMGGDMTYSVSLTDPSEHCDVGRKNGSLRCIYRWNLGGFFWNNIPEYRGIGVPYFRGSTWRTVGLGPLNGYIPRFEPAYPFWGRPYMIAGVARSHRPDACWFDAESDATYNTDMTVTFYVTICEVQRNTDTDTFTFSLTASETPSKTFSSTPTFSVTPTSSLSPTLSFTPTLSSTLSLTPTDTLSPTPTLSTTQTHTIPTPTDTFSLTPTESRTLLTPTSTILHVPILPDKGKKTDNWLRGHWWVILLIVLLVLLLALLILLVFCCRGRRKQKALFASEWEPPFDLQSGSLFADEKNPLKAPKPSEDDSPLGMETWSPLEGDAVRVEERTVPVRMDSVEMMPLVPPAVAAPSELSAHTGQRRRSTVRSTRHRVRGKGRASTNVFSDVEIPEGCEINDENNIET